MLESLRSLFGRERRIDVPSSGRDPLRPSEDFWEKTEEEQIKELRLLQQIREQLEAVPAEEGPPKRLEADTFEAIPHLGAHAIEGARSHDDTPTRRPGAVDRPPAGSYAIVPSDQIRPREGVPTAPGAEGSYEYGFGDAKTVDEFYDSIDNLMERARRHTEE